MCSNIDWINVLIKGASVAAIVTLLFAVITYWIDFRNRFKFKKQMQEQLVTELRTVYFTCSHEIYDYDGFMLAKDKLVYKYPTRHISVPICNYILNSGYLWRISKNKSVRTNLLLVIDGVNLLDEGMKEHNSHPLMLHNKEKMADFVFENRYVIIRDRILEISEQNDFFSMNIVPTNQYRKNQILMRWHNKGRVRKKHYQNLTMQMLGFNEKYAGQLELEKKSIAIIEKYLPAPKHIYRKIPDFEKLDKLLAKIIQYLATKK